MRGRLNRSGPVIMEVLVLKHDDKLPEQWYAFVRGLTRLYEETGLRFDCEDLELYSPKGINGEHFFPLPIWQSAYLDDTDDYADADEDNVVGEYISPFELQRREEEAARKATAEWERREFERLKTKFGGKP